jgi:hypothetical protein
MLALAGLSQAGEEIRNHQYYEPVNDPEALAFVDQAFAEAVRLYGQPAAPVREVFIRRSVPRRNLALLSRADVIDWKTFADKLWANRANLPYSRLWARLDESGKKLLEKCARGMEPDRAGRMRIIDSLNAMISDKSFYHAEEFRDLPPEIAKAKGGFFRSNHENLNRRLLSFMFPRCFLPLPERKAVAEKFQLCEAESAGRYVIYISTRPQDAEFYPALGHECCHLLNPRLFDWYIEGQCNVFSEKIARITGKSWQTWEKKFRQGGEPYSIAYQMMKEIDAAAPNALKHLLGAAEGRAIDPDRWLGALEAEDRQTAATAINRHARALAACKGQMNSFVLPGQRRTREN